MRRILIVEDHPIVAMATTLSIRRHLPDIDCFQADSFWNALELVKAKPFDLVILDLYIPGGNSIQMIERLRSLQSQVRILVFTGLEEDMYALSFIKAGANGFLSKKSSDPEFRLAIETVLFRNRIYISDKIHQETLALYFKPQKGENNAFSILSDREMEILQLLYARRRLSEICEILHLSPSRVSNHRMQIFRKMGVDNIVDLVKKYELLMPPDGLKGRGRAS